MLDKHGSQADRLLVYTTRDRNNYRTQAIFNMLSQCKFSSMTCLKFAWSTCATLMQCTSTSPLFALAIWLAPLALQPALAVDLQKHSILLKEDFERGADGELARKLLAHPRKELANGSGPDGSDAIRVAYVGFDKGSERVGVRYPLRRKVAQASLTFDVCFEKDFQWTHGGKLHGLGPKLPVSGGKIRRPDGWSARIVFKKDGRCSTYLYDQNLELKYGMGQTTDRPVFMTGTWHHVCLQVWLNNPGQHDGLARILIDDQEVLSTEDVCFRGEGGTDTLIQNFLFSTFHGGNTSKWTPIDKQGNPTTVYALFDNFLVTSENP